MTNTPFSTGLSVNDAPKPPPPFASRAELGHAMRDPRYAPEVGGRPNPQHDPAYRLEVLQRGEAIAHRPHLA